MIRLRYLCEDSVWRRMVVGQKKSRNRPIERFDETSVRQAIFWHRALPDSSSYELRIGWRAIEGRWGEPGAPYTEPGGPSGEVSTGFGAFRPVALGRYDSTSRCLSWRPG